MNKKEEFLSLYNKHIAREGADKLIEYLLSSSSDFFTAPASTRFHGSCEGGLVEHSINVYTCLKDYLERDRVKDEFYTYKEGQKLVDFFNKCFNKIDVYKSGFSSRWS